MERTLTAEQAALSLEIESEGVAWLIFDTGTDRLNILTSAVLHRLAELLDEVEREHAAGRMRALIIRSGKDGSFIAGANIKEFTGITSAAEGEAGSRAGQQLFQRVDRLPLPVVAAVDGICLGGGTELILACDYRLASDRRETKIGLPEVRLGILPGFGGTTRLPRVIGVRGALDLILTGKNLDARRALRAGLIHEKVHPAQLYERARAKALELAEGKRQAAPSRRLMDRLLDETGPGRKLVLKQARKKVKEETRGHYPAPLAILDVIERSLGKPIDEALAIEAAALGQLIVTPQSRNLIHVYHLLEGAKKAGPRAVKPRPVARVAVLGAGVMGGGIAQLLAGRGVDVRLKDIRAEALAAGLRHARQLFAKAVQRKRLQQRELQRNMDRISPTLDYSGFNRIDLVIEAVLERMDVKQQVLQEVEAQVPGGCVITSNTSSLSITEMARALTRPQDFCGMHFFNPVHRMPLVEVIRGEQTSDEAVATVVALAKRLEKTPVIVRDGAGFLVNRVLAPYLNEAGWLLADGARIERVDEALLQFGMPMGPFRLLDEIGLDVARHAGRTMADAFGERLAPPGPMVALEQTKLLGKKGGLGFYKYEGEKQGDVNADIYRALGAGGTGSRTPSTAKEIQDRAVFAMINEAARVLGDGIAGSPADVDIGMITGTGFPPFRGGLLRYADSLGLRAVLARLEELERTYGVRFAAAPLIREYAAAGRGFYDTGTGSSEG